MSKLLAVLGHAHAIAVLRAVAASREGTTFSTVKRLVGIDSRTATTRFRELQGLGLVACENTLYKATEKGQRVLDTVARLHMEADAEW